MSHCRIIAMWTTKQPCSTSRNSLKISFLTPKPPKIMAKATYTPTHCPKTGRKFTKAERRAANKAKFAAEQANRTKSPKATKAKVERKGQLKVTHLGDELNTRVYTLDKPKATKAPKTTAEVFTAPLMRKTKAELVEMLLELVDSKPEVKPEPKADAAPEFTEEELASMDDLTSVSYRPVMVDESPEPTKPKGRKTKAPKARKARKATPAQRVADKQERARLPKADSAVTKMVFGKPDADVDAAREAARNLSERKRFDRAIKLAKKWQYARNFGGCFLTEQQEELTRLTGHTGITTYFEAVAVLA